MAKCAQRYRHQLVTSWLCRCFSAPSNCTLKELFRNHRNHFSGWANHCEDYSWIRVLFVSIHFSGEHLSKCVNVWGSWRTKMDSLFYSIRCCFLFQPQTRDSDRRFKGTRVSTTTVIIYKEKCPFFLVMSRNVWHFLSLLSAFDMLKTG